LDRTYYVTYAKQLSQILGNNSQVLANNTYVGNPNASLAEKVVTATRNPTNQSSLGKNASGAGSTVLNETVEVGKKIVGGAADVISKDPPIMTEGNISYATKY
jgi:hypothetical protein